MKHVYLVHIFKRGAYSHTVNVAFNSLAAANKYIDDCGEYGQAQKVEVIGLKDF